MRIGLIKALDLPKKVQGHLKAVVILVSTSRSRMEVLRFLSLGFKQVRRWAYTTERAVGKEGRGAVAKRSASN
jgi:hypothetical protein